MARTFRWLSLAGLVFVFSGCPKSTVDTDAGSARDSGSGKLGDGGVDAGTPGGDELAASVTVTLMVPAALAKSPFDAPRTLVVPKGFSVEVLARVPHARFLLALPNGDLLVSQPAEGKISRLQAADLATRTDFVTGLNLPQDMVLHAPYLYVGEEDGVTRYTFDPATSAVTAKTKVVSGLPTGGNHRYKDIAVAPDGTLYVDLGSSDNVSPDDFKLDPMRASIYAYDGDGQNRRLVATGVRNGEGLDFVPGTSELWVVVNNRDNIRYPFHDDGGIAYGTIEPEGYVDNHPPEELAHVVTGANFGWPYCNPNPDQGFSNMPFVPDADPETQKFLDGGAASCDSMTRIDRGMQAHSAPLGITFGQGTAVPTAYASGAFVAFHGSWNRTKPTGYKIVWFPWDSAGKPGDAIDFVRGWSPETATWGGRPVDIAIDAQGRILVSDDGTGTVYRMTYTP